MALYIPHSIFHLARLLCVRKLLDPTTYVGDKAPVYWLIVNGAVELLKCDATSLGVRSRNRNLEDGSSIFSRNVRDAAPYCRRTAAPSTSLHLIITKFFTKHIFRSFREPVCIQSIGAANTCQRMYSAGGNTTDGKEAELEVLFSATCPQRTKHGLPGDRTRAPAMQYRRIIA
jgi:hypothetical protein